MIHGVDVRAKIALAAGDLSPGLPEDVNALSALLKRNRFMAER